MRSRAIREGSVGLFVLVGLGLLSAVIFWIRGISLRGQAYQLEIELPDALGLDVGSPVRFRGVVVGRVVAVDTAAAGVNVVTEIKPASLLMPRDSGVEVLTSGFAGQAKLDFLPPETIPKSISASEDLSPFGDNCDPQLILCDGDRLAGTVGPSLDQLTRSANRLATLLETSNVLDNANETLNSITRSTKMLGQDTRVTLKNVSRAAVGINQLSQDSRREVRRLGSKLGNTADQLSNASEQVTSVIEVNRGTLGTTLNNLESASQDLKVALNDLGPFIARAEQSQIIENLDTLSADGAEAAKNLKSITTTAQNPVLALGLVQTLDSARVTFQNTKKITTDLEEITGNPQFRQNLLKLINGLSKLLSSTQDLERQIQVVKNSDFKALDAKQAPLTMPSTDQQAKTSDTSTLP